MFYLLTVYCVTCLIFIINAVLVGLPAYLLRRLQSVMNPAARIIFGLRRTDHISDTLITLHWLQAQERVLFMMAVPVTICYALYSVDGYNPGP